MRELIIDGVVADIGEVEFGFQYKSFLFSGISNIQGQRSWTLTLPNTAVNRGIFAQSGFVDCVTVRPWRRINNVYYYDLGYTIIEGGTCVLMSAKKDGFEVCITFGEAFTKLRVLSEKTLQDITETEGDIVKWDKDAVSTLAPVNGVGMAEYYQATNQDKTFPEGSTDPDGNMPMIVTHPYVMVDRLLDEIEQSSGLYFPDLRKLSSDYCLGIVLKTLNGEKSFVRTEKLKVGNYPDNGFPVDGLIAWNNNGTNEFELPIKLINGTDLYLDKTPLKENRVLNQPWFREYELDKSHGIESVSVKISGSIYCTNELGMGVKRRSDTESFYKISHSGFDETKQAFEYVFDVEFDVSDAFSIVILLPIQQGIEFSEVNGNVYWFNFGNTIQDTTTVDISVNRSKAFYSKIADIDGFYPIIPNLPKLKFSEFIGDLCKMFGLFPYMKSMNDTTVQFNSADIMFERLKPVKTTNIGLTETIQSAVGTGSPLSITAVATKAVTIPKTTRIRFECRFSYPATNTLKIYAGTSNSGTLLVTDDLSDTDYSYKWYDVAEGENFFIEATSVVGMLTTQENKVYYSKASIGVGLEYLNPSQQKIYDWSDRLIKTTNNQSHCEESKFTIGDYGQTNTIDYKENDEKIIKTLGRLFVDSENLEVTKELAQLKLGKCDRQEGSNIIQYPLYDVSLVDNVLNVKYQGSGFDDNICSIRLNPTTNKYTAYFGDELFFDETKPSGLIATHYQGYQKVIRRPRVETEIFQLKASDLHKFDLSVPIYLSQYGKYYAILEMNVDDNYLAKCDLLEIKEV